MGYIPPQLQKFTDVSIASGPGGSKVRNYSFGDHVVISAGETPVVDYTVNVLLRFLKEDFHGMVSAIGDTKSDERFRPFDSDFGDEVVFPNGVLINTNQVANEIIEIFRVLWKNRATRAGNRTGKATSVLN